MKLLKPFLKIVAESVNQRLYNRAMSLAQKKAYATTCKNSHGFNPFWHEDYKRNLKKNQRKAKKDKELISTIIKGL